MNTFREEAPGAESAATYTFLQPDFSLSIYIVSPFTPITSPTYSFGTG